MAKHIKKIQRFLEANDLDALLLNSKTMKKYLATLSGGGCHVLITREQGYLILDGRYVTEAHEIEHDLQIILTQSHKSGNRYLDTIIEIMAKQKLKKLGVEGAHILVKEYHEIKKNNIEICLLDEEIGILRIQKNAFEIKAMKEAIKITDEIFVRVLCQMHIGMCEFEISALLQYYAIKAGASKMSFDTIVGSGERSAMPHGRPSNKKIKAHEPILIDFGIQYNNYQSDMTRMVFFGKPDPEIEKIYDIVLKAQLAGIAAMRTGAIGCDVDKAARDVIAKHGYGEYFNHGLGHGLGIGDGSELPILNEASKIVLDEHMMMSCEPGIYLPGVGGVRIEDDILIENGIGIPLNKTTKGLMILKED